MIVCINFGRVMTKLLEELGPTRSCAEGSLFQESWHCPALESFVCLGLDSWKIGLLQTTESL